MNGADGKYQVELIAYVFSSKKSNKMGSFDLQNTHIMLLDSKWF